MVNDRSASIDVRLDQGEHSVSYLCKVLVKVDKLSKVKHLEES